MKKKVLIILAISALLLTGCGDSVYELTDEEQGQIVAYAARVISRANIYQKDGESYVNKSAVLANTSKKSKADSETIAEADTQTSEATESEETNNQADNQATNPDANMEVKPTTEKISWQAVTGNEQVSITYQDSYLSDTFMPQEVFAIDAGNGKTFFVMEFTMVNKSAEPCSVSIPGTFTLKTDKEIAVKSTIWTYDLANSEKIIDLKGNETATATLLFPINKTDAESINAFSLLYKLDSSTKQLEL